MSKVVAFAYNESGLQALVASRRDTKILCLQRFVRFFAFGSSTLVLTLFLTGLGHSAGKTGLFMTLTLLGDVIVSLVLTVIADKIGRRRMLALGALLMSASGVIFALFSQFWILVIASILGVISPSGAEIGPFRAIEESTIAQLVSSVDRSNVIVWYTLFGTAGAALGSITIGWIVNVLQQKYQWTAVDSYRTVFWVYAALGLVKFSLCLLLTQDCEVQHAVQKSKRQSGEQQPLLAETNSNHDDSARPNEDSKSKGITSLLPSLSAHTVNLIFRLCLLFAMDSFGSGIASNSWLVYFFNDKFGVEEGKLGSLFFFTNVLSAFSNLIAASFARRIGLIKTMVLTHLPASIILAIISLPNNEVVAMVLLLARSSMSSMDQAPRQAFLAAAVLPEERTTVMGIVNVCKTLSQAGGPIVTGTLANSGKIGIAFVIAGCLKCAYDVFMLGMFLGYKTIEEKAQAEVENGPQSVREEANTQTSART